MGWIYSGTQWIGGYPFTVGQKYPKSAIGNGGKYYSGSNAAKSVTPPSYITHIQIHAFYQNSDGSWPAAPIQVYVASSQNGSYSQGGFVKAAHLGPNLTKYTIAYNGNNGASVTGGTTISSIPASTTKYKGVTAKLSSTVPTSSNKSITDTVNFNANGGSGTGAASNKLTATRSIKFTFKNWNTHYYGTGTAYASGANYTADASTTLYAIWTPALASASKITLPTPTTRAGYTFKGWYTAASGGTRVGGAGSAYTFSSSTSLSSQSTTLYAQWTPYRVITQYNINGGTINSNILFNENKTKYGVSNNLVIQYTRTSTSAAWTSKTLTDESGVYYGTSYYNLWSQFLNASSKTGYHTEYAKAYNTKADETGINLHPDSSSDAPTNPVNTKTLNGGTEITGNKTITIYVNWIANTYAIAFNANGGTGTMSSISMTYGITKTLPENTFTKTGYKFTGWATSAGGSKIYNDKQTVSNLTTSNNVTVTLYAVWEPIHYHIQFNDNSNGEATGSVDSMLNLTYDQLYTLPSTQVYTRKKYYPNGWNTAADGSGIAYPDGLEIRNLTNVDNEIVTLYAQWIKEESSPVYIKVNDVWKEGTLYIKKDGEWKQGTVWIRKNDQYIQI